MRSAVAGLAVCVLLGACSSGEGSPTSARPVGTARSSAAPTTDPAQLEAGGDQESPLLPGPHHTTPDAQAASSFEVTQRDWIGGQRRDGSWNIREGGPDDASALGFVEVGEVAKPYRAQPARLRLPGLQVGPAVATSFAGRPAVRATLTASREVPVPQDLPLGGFRFARGDHGVLLVVQLDPGRSAVLYVGALTLSASAWEARLQPVFRSWQFLP